MPLPKQEKREAPKTAKMRVYEALRDWIIDGTLEPGEKIMDSEISAYFSVSRTPVREAMQLLADQKLLDIIPGRESRVSQVGVVDIIQTYRMIGELQAMALEFAYPKIDQAVIDSLTEINKNFEAACNRLDVRKERTYDTEFHNIFIELAENDFLKNFCETMNAHVGRIEIMYFNQLENEKNSISEHAAIIEALQKKNLELAKVSMRRNWEHTAEIIEKAGLTFPAK